MQPISVKREAQYGGPSSSKDFNQWINDSYYDLTQLFNIAAEHGIRIPENMNMLIAENIFLQKKLDELESLLNNIQANIGTQNKTLYKSFYTNIDTLAAPGYLALESNTDYGLLHIPRAQEVSKLYLIDMTGNTFIPKTLGYTLYESTTPFEISSTTISGAQVVMDANIEKALDGNRYTFWLRKSLQDTTVNEVFFCLELRLPTNIINHTRANVIYFDPSPLSSFTLLDIQYLTTTEWQRLPSYPTEVAGGNTVPKAINSLRNTMFAFPTRDIVGLRIYCKQPNWFLESGQRSFLYGFKNIDIKYAVFNTEEARARIRFDIPDSSKQFSSITSVEPMFAEGSLKDPALIPIHGIYIDGSLTKFNLGETLPALTKTVYVEMGIKISNDTSPLLNGLKISYEYL